MFDSDAHMPKINRGMVYLGACLIAGIRLAREGQVNGNPYLLGTKLCFLRPLAGWSNRSGFLDLRCDLVKDVSRLKEILDDIHDGVNFGQLRRVTPVGSSTTSVKSHVKNLPVLLAYEALNLQLLQLFCEPPNVTHLIHDNHVHYGTNTHHR